MANVIPEKIYGSYTEVILVRHSYPIVEAKMAKEFAANVKTRMDDEYPNWPDMSDIEFMSALEDVARDVFCESDFFPDTEMEEQYIDTDHTYFELEEDLEELNEDKEKE